jgi:hypothetical protein
LEDLVKVLYVQDIPQELELLELLLRQLEEVEGLVILEKVLVKMFLMVAVVLVSGLASLVSVCLLVLVVVPPED